MSVAAPTRAQAPMDGAAFASVFAEGWRAPGGADGFAAHFLPHMAPDVRMRQPLTPTVVGHDEFRELFGGLFDLIPDLHGEVHRWAADGDTLFIEFTLSGTLGARPVAWRVVDRITLSGGLVAERDSYFDPLPLTGALLRRPAIWPRWWRLVARSLFTRRRKRGAR